jgi:hypothetical protein
MMKGSLKIRIPHPHKGDVGGPRVRETLRQAGIASADWDQA